MTAPTEAGTGFQNSLVDETTYQQAVTEIKNLNANRTKMRWEIGDIVLRVAGLPGSNEIGLRKLATDIGQSERYCNDARKVSHAFPDEHLRDYQIPWLVYLAASTQGELKAKIVTRYRERRQSEGGGPGRVNSGLLINQVIDEVRRTSGTPPTSARRTETATLTAQIDKWLNRFNHGKIPAHQEDFRNLSSAAEEVVTTIRPIKGI